MTRRILDHRALIWVDRTEKGAVLKKINDWKNDELYVIHASYYMETFDKSFEKNLVNSQSNFLSVIRGLRKLNDLKLSNLKIVSIKDVESGFEDIETNNRGGVNENLADETSILTLKVAKALQAYIVTATIKSDDNEQYKRVLGTSYALSSSLFSPIDRKPTNSACVSNGCTWVTRGGTTFWRTCSRHG